MGQLAWSILLSEFRLDLGLNLADTFLLPAKVPVEHLYVVYAASVNHPGARKVGIWVDWDEINGRQLPEEAQSHDHCVPHPTTRTLLCPRFAHSACSLQSCAEI